MTDLRRTLLWVVFSMSLVLIWDAWNRHNGEPSMFGPAPVAKPAAAGAPTAPGAVPVPLSPRRRRLPRSPGYTGRGRPRPQPPLHRPSESPSPQT